MATEYADTIKHIFQEATERVEKQGDARDAIEEFMNTKDPTIDDYFFMTGVINDAITQAVEDVAEEYSDAQDGERIAYIRKNLPHLDKRATDEEVKQAFIEDCLSRLADSEDEADQAMADAIACMERS